MLMFRKGLESGALKMAKESGKGSNHYKLKTPPKVIFLRMLFCSEPPACPLGEGNLLIT